MIKKKLILYGAGGHAKSCIDIIENQKKYKIVGLIGKIDELNKKVLGYKVIGTDKDLLKLRKITKNIILAIGPIKKNELIKKKFLKLKLLGFNFPKVISPTSYVSKHASIGDGSIIFNKCIINAGASIGKNCVINSGTIIEHDVKISNHCNISTSITINGNVEVGENSFIGSGVNYSVN